MTNKYSVAIQSLIDEKPDFSVFEGENYDNAWRAFHGDFNAAFALHTAMLPGWFWFIGSCYLTDDAAVSPDFNSKHSAIANIPVLIDGIEWSEYTDIAFNPPGKPARAWLMSILSALERLE